MKINGLDGNIPLYVFLCGGLVGVQWGAVGGALGVQRGCSRGGGVKVERERERRRERERERES